MSSRLQQTQLLSNANFQQQAQGSLIALAVNVVTVEATTAPNHANRLAYANAILMSPQTLMLQMLPGMLSQAAIVTAAGNATVNATSGTLVADADCDAAVITLFNYYANQYAAQLTSGAPLMMGH